MLLRGFGLFVDSCLGRSFSERSMKGFSFSTNLQRRRSSRMASSCFPVLGVKAAAVSDEKLASASGLETMRKGGNAADAAVTMAATLGMVQPMSCGIGGDCFGIFYDASKRTVLCLDGSGRSPASLSRDAFYSGMRDGRMMPDSKGLLATVPGAVRAWFEIVEHFGTGKLTMAELLEPAIFYGDESFPVGTSCAAEWRAFQSRLRKIHGGRVFLNKDGLTPIPGEVWRNASQAALLKRIASEGPGAVYEGSVARNIVDAVKSAGGVMTLDDLQFHVKSTESTILPAISTTYREVTVHTTPPPSQGAVLLEALNIMEGFDVASLQSKPSEFYHLMLEALRLALADGLSDISDVQFASIDRMSSKEHAKKKRSLIDQERAMKSCAPEGLPRLNQAGTLVAAAVDPQGNACCLISSTGIGFGCAVVPEHGFPVQARGMGFNTVPGHPNCVAPRKKPYHTLMPVLVTDTRSGKLLAVMGTQGAAMQPQAILQVLLSMIDHGLNPQDAVTKLRIKIGSIENTHPDDPLTIEEDMDAAEIKCLKEKGHRVKHILNGWKRVYMGQVEVIAKEELWRIEAKQSKDEQATAEVLWCGTDPRCDGGAVAY